MLVTKSNKLTITCRRVDVDKTVEEDAEAKKAMAKFEESKFFISVLFLIRADYSKGISTNLLANQTKERNIFYYMYNYCPILSLYCLSQIADPSLRHSSKLASRLNLLCLPQLL